MKPSSKEISEAIHGIRPMNHIFSGNTYSTSSASRTENVRSSRQPIFQNIQAQYKTDTQKSVVIMAHILVPE